MEQEKALVTFFDDKSVAENQKVQIALQSFSPEEMRNFKLSIIDIASDKTLAECDKGELCAVALKATAMGLPINKELGLAHIVAFRESIKDKYGKNVGYKMTPSLIPAVRGIKALALDTGLVEAMNEGTVFEGELQNFNKMRGTFDIDELKRKSDKVIGYFAYIRLINGFEKSNFISAVDAKAHALKYSKEVVWENGQRTKEKKLPTFWVNEFDKMATKTVVKQLLKATPLLSKSSKTRQLFDAIREDDNFEENNNPIIDIPTPQPKPAKEKIINKETGEVSEIPDIPNEDLPFPVDDEEPTQPKTYSKEFKEAAELTFTNGEYKGKTIGYIANTDIPYIKKISMMDSQGNEKGQKIIDACKIIIKEI